MHVFVSVILLILVVAGCNDFGTTPYQDTGIQGQVFLISKPGPIPIGWVPPPLEQVYTIRVLDAQRRTVLEATTNEKGKFMISLQPGTYYLRVKESPIPAETGPYLVDVGKIISVEAHFDNGMR